MSKMKYMVLNLFMASVLSQAHADTLAGLQAQMKKACAPLKRQTYVLRYPYFNFFGIQAESEAKIILHRSETRVALITWSAGDVRNMVSDGHFKKKGWGQMRCVFQPELCAETADYISSFLKNIGSELISSGTAVDAENAQAVRCAEARLSYLSKFAEDIHLNQRRKELESSYNDDAASSELETKVE